MEISTCTRKLEALASLRGHLAIPSESVKTEVVASSEGITWKRDGFNSCTLEGEYKAGPSSVSHDFFSHGVIAEAFRASGVMIPEVISHADEALVAGAERGCVKVRTAYNINNAKLEFNSSLDRLIQIHEDKENRNLSELSASQLGTEIESRSEFLLLLLVKADKIDINGMDKLVSLFTANSQGKIECVQTDNYSLSALSFSDANKIDLAAFSLTESLNYAQSINWQNPNLSNGIA